MKTELSDLFKKAVIHLRGTDFPLPWGWDMSAVDALSDAILCAENGNMDGANAYIAEAADYLDAIHRGVQY